MNVKGFRKNKKKWLCSFQKCYSTCIQNHLSGW